MLPRISLFGLDLPTYFIVISFACVLCTLWFVRRADKRGLTRVTSIDLTMIVLIGGFLGARLLHVFYEEPQFYRAHPFAIFEVWNGGFVFLGGVIGAWLFGMIFCIFKREPFWFWADLAVIPISLGYAIGRLGCFLNGCCYGRFCTLPWAINLHGTTRHPTQLYAVFWELAVLIVLLKIEPKVRMSGTLFSIWLVLHALGRVMMEFFRDDPRGPLIYSISLGTGLSLVLGLAGSLSLLLRSGHKRLV